MKNRLIILGAAAFLLIAGSGFFWPFGRTNSFKLPAIIEIQEVRLGSKVGGRIASMKVQEGDHVEPGQELIVFEVPELENMKEQLQSRLDAAEADFARVLNGPRKEEKDAAIATAAAAQARYDKLKEGWREEEKRWAGSELESAAAELKLSVEDLERTNDLYRSKSASKAEFDGARGNHDRAKGRYNVAKAKVDMYTMGSRKEEVAEARAEWAKTQAHAAELENGSRSEDKALAKARRDEAAAKVREVAINLREAVVRVPNDPAFKNALVEVLPNRPGDIVAANQPVVRLLCVRDLWVKTFVPETKLGKVTINQKVEVRIDSHPGKKFEGVVFHRAPSSEFTPRNVQSVDERRYQVFAVKIRVADPQGVFNAGMAAEVTLEEAP